MALFGQSVCGVQECKSLKSVCGVLLQLLVALVYLSLSCFTVISTGRVEGGVIKCKPTERAALLDFKKAAEDWHYSYFFGPPSTTPTVFPLSHEQKERWAWFKWDEEEEECCNWQGVVCDATSGRISQLRLPSSCAAYTPFDHSDITRPGQCRKEMVQCGQLPASLSRLESLEVLDVRGGCFFSSAPTFSSFTNLSHLDLSGNPFQDPLFPDHSLKQLLLPRLVYLNLSNTGSGVALNLSKLMGSVPNLEYLDLGSTFIQDWGIPEQIDSLHNLKYLDLSNNYLQGVIPQQIGSLPNMKHLDLSINQLQGAIPRQIGSLHNLKHLDLSYNYLQGVIPQQIGSLQNLAYLDLQGNSFRNPAPWPSLANLSHLSHLGLGNGYNSAHDLTSYIPLDWPEARDEWQCNWKALESLSAFNIRFAFNYTNSLPFCLHDRALVTQLQHLYFENPHLGSLSIAPLLCSLLAVNAPLSLETLSLPSTSLWEFETEHSQPAWLQALHTPVLQVLDLSRNRLSGIPLWLDPHLPLLQSLDMSSNNLSTFPPQLEHDLPAMKSLTFSSNQIRGAIPTFLLKPSLLRLDVSDNNLSGDLPFSLGNLSSLSHLDLSYNSLTGKIPHSIGSLSSLVSLDLCSNSLKGNIPHSIGSLSSLVSLDLSSNSLKGNIPHSIGNLSSLVSLSLSYNSLKGNIPPSIGNLSYLEFLALSNNSLGGNTPTDILQDSLVFLDFSHNQLVGNLPKLRRCLSLSSLDMSNNLLGSALELNAFQNCPLLSVLALSNNQFSSLSFRNFHSHLNTLDISNNQLGGEIPKEMATHCPNLEFLDLSNNILSGALPVEIGNISRLFELAISNNLLSSEIPASLGKLSGLGVLELYGNKLNGRLPPSLQNCSSLNILDVGYNQLSGSIPQWLNGKIFRYLEVLIMSHNQFQSSTPILVSLVQNFTELQILSLASNLLRGVIPSNLNRLQAMITPIVAVDVAYTKVQVTIKGAQENLTENNYYYIAALDLSDNQLEGGIPPEIGALKGLFSLNLSHNLLNGSIPSSLGELAGALESLDLSNNQLTGSIPSELCDFNFLGALDLSHNRLRGTISASCSHLCTFDETHFADNDGLHYKCSTVRDDQDTHTPPPPLAHASPNLYDHTSLMGKLQEYISMAGWGIGHIVGFVLMTLFLRYRARTD